MAHREDIRAYLEGLAPVGNCIDWGSGAKPVIRYVQSQKARFDTIDNNPKVNPGRLWDITKPIKIYEADHAFCMEVLEHVKEPQAVVDNMFNNLKEGGMVHLSVPFLYPVHGEEDYWRFTDQGLKYLFRNFSEIKIWEITDGYLMEAVK